MSLFKSKKQLNVAPTPVASAVPGSGAILSTNSVLNASTPADLVLNVIHDGVIMTNNTGVIQYINPAAASMAGLSSALMGIGLDFGVIMRLESKDGTVIPDGANPLAQAVRTNRPLEAFQCRLIVGQTDKRIPISASTFPSGTGGNVITFRNITKELQESSEQADFISTASHEMRTPVASIEGYLSLCLNPQTATVDERARGYLEAAHTSAKHLGKLFQDLLDVTKMDDGHIRPTFTPVEMVTYIGEMMKNYLPQATNANIQLIFGSDRGAAPSEGKRLQQVVYGYIDENFMNEIMNNLIENAIKYSPNGGAIFVNVRGDGDRIIISVADTGMGISANDIGHIFQKFYRADNSDTRTIGGTGLGLYLVKQRVEAMGGRIWAESVYGDGSTFFISLPRLSDNEYEKRMISVYNNLNGGTK